ncbi:MULTISPECIES: hypothetical protein [Bradyrhizobium]|uniref:hypothetical protein n=1 Tax=Bradyrhizobium brasilense TaxID=1419277 RepID=UPI001456E31D|nr:hypothetical protein [Bradyrhizobium brasilense]
MMFNVTRPEFLLYVIAALTIAVLSLGTNRGSWGESEGVLERPARDAIRRL